MRDDEQKSSMMPVVVIVAFIGFLAVAVIVPNLSRPDPRVTRASEAKRDLRNLAVNLETYFIDHYSYPPAVDGKLRVVPLGKSDEGISAGFVPWMLTTPVAYTSVIPDDRFRERVRYVYNYPEDTYRYATNGESCWILLSDGPDQDVDIVAAHFPSPATGNCDRTIFLSQFGGPAIEYDGSNGIQSSGDIIRVGP